MAGLSENTGLEIRSLVKSDGELVLTLRRVPIPEPGADEVVIRVEATPINPSDNGLAVWQRVSRHGNRPRVGNNR